MLGEGETNLLVSNIVDVTVGSDEGVSEDPAGRESTTVHGESSDDTVAISEFQIENVFNLRDVVFDTSDGEDHIGEAFLGAGNGVDAIDEIVLGIGDLDHTVDISLGSSQPGCTGIRDDLDGLGVGVRSHGEARDGELPVSEGRELGVSDGTVTVGGIKTTIGDLTGVTSLGEGELTIEPDGEEFLIELGKGILDWGDDVVDGKVWPSETEDTINGLVTEDISDRFSETESLVINLDTSEVEGIRGQVTVARSGSVLDGEELTVLDVGGGFGGVKLMLGEARIGVSLAGLGSALDVNNPQV